MSAGFEEGEGHPQGVPLRGFGGGLGTHEGRPGGECGAVCVGRGWALRCLRWLTPLYEIRRGVGGSSVAAGRQGRITRTLAAAGGFRRGGVAGAEPPHKGGPNRPDRPTAVVSG